MPLIRVEFFGVARLKSKRDSIEIEADCIGELFRELQEQLPDFAGTCFPCGELSKEFLLSINGTQFTRDPEWQLNAGDEVLILSADVGG